MFDGKELVEMKWHPANKNKYIQQGYVYTFIGDSFLARAEDVLKISSGAKIPVYCDYCGEKYWPTARNYQKHREHDTVDCCMTCKGKKIKSTVMSKYGVSNIMQVKEVKQKHQSTCIERYGASSPLASKDIYQKTQDSFNQHYNTKNGIADLRKIEELNKKIQNTNIAKYHGISPFCSEDVRKRIRTTLYNNGSCPTSQKQIDLNDMICRIFGNCELNYPCDKVSLDCMTFINGVKIDVEYDGWYWHKDSELRDRRRDNYVKSQGYKILRIVAYADRLPTEEELVESIDVLINTNKWFHSIKLNKY